MPRENKFDWPILDFFMKSSRCMTGDASAMKNK